MVKSRIYIGIFIPALCDSPAVIRAVLFDMDETLVENPYPYSVIRERVQDFLISRGVPRRDVLAMRRTYEDTLRLSAEHDLGDEPLKFLEDEEVRRAEMSRPHPEALPLLGWLRERGLKIAVITRNTRRAAEIALAPLMDFIDLVLAREDVRNAKPHPDHVLTALEALSVSPSEAVVVGDYPYDIEAGKRAGCITVGINTEAHYTVEGLGRVRDLLELLNLIEEGSSASPAISRRGQ